MAVPVPVVVSVTVVVVVVVSVSVAVVGLVVVLVESMPMPMPMPVPMPVSVLVGVLVCMIAADAATAKSANRRDTSIDRAVVAAPPSRPVPILVVLVVLVLLAGPGSLHWAGLQRRCVLQHPSCRQQRCWDGRGSGPARRG